jgi:hypothetical protein
MFFFVGPSTCFTVTRKISRKSYVKSDALHGPSWCAMRTALETCFSVYMGDMYFSHRNRTTTDRAVRRCSRVQNVRKWCMQFESDRTDILDTYRTSQPSTSRTQWNFLGQTTASRCEGFPTFRGLSSRFTTSRTDVKSRRMAEPILEN